MKKVAIIMGTRPEIIKLSPIIKLLKNNGIVIFTGQHFDYEMSLRFIDELKIPKPDYSMKLSKISNTTTDRARQIGEIITKLSTILNQIKVDSIIVQGDTNTVLASAVCGLKCNIPISHVESGLRSYDWRMPEEHNRIAVDHISELLFAPTNINKRTLSQENVHGKIFVTGNTSIDSVENEIKKININSNVEIPFNDFLLVTMHRGENVDNPIILKSIINGLINCKENIMLPIHPRTKKRLHQFGFYKKLSSSKNIKIISNVGYFNMLKLLKNCKFVVSDSGGIQEEATAPSIRKKVLVIRDSTDRPEAVESGFSELVGTKTTNILKAIKQNSENSKIHTRSHPYGTGKSSRNIIRILKNEF